MEGPISDEKLELLLANLPGERVTEEYMKSRIADRSYTRLPGGTMTICQLTLDNKFVIIGKSACVDPANYNQGIGERIAYQDAFIQLWPLFGFLLAEKIKLRYMQSEPGL